MLRKLVIRLQDGINEAALNAKRISVGMQWNLSLECWEEYKAWTSFDSCFAGYNKDQMLKMANLGPEPSPVYLIDMTKAYRKNSWVCIVGMCFDPRPGEFLLPAQEGRWISYEKEGKMWLKMATNKNPIWYEHPHVWPNTFNDCIDAGWVRWFNFVGLADTWRPEHVYASVHALGGAKIQKDHFKAIISSDKLLSSMRIQLPNFEWDVETKFDHAGWIGLVS